MHNPPPVSYQINRSRWVGVALAFVWLLGTINLTFFAWLQRQVPLAVGLAVLALLTGFWVLRGWLRMPTGTLHWDGEQLHWQQFQTPVHSVHIVLDMDFLLLLRLTDSLQRSDAVFLSRSSGQDWSAIRRALVAFRTVEPGAHSQ